MISSTTMRDIILKRNKIFELFLENTSSVADSIDKGVIMNYMN